MEYTYKLQPIDLMSGKSYSVTRSDGAYVPIDEANTDYQAYLKWLEEGNTPLPADE